MPRSPSQEAMDAARGDPEGKLRSAAWEAYSARREETNARGRDPDCLTNPHLVLGTPMVLPTFRIADIRPWVVFHEPSFVAVPADPGPKK